MTDKAPLHDRDTMPGVLRQMAKYAGLRMAVLDEAADLIDTLRREVEFQRSGAVGLNDVLLHWRDRSSGYMNAPEFKRDPFRSPGSAFERAAGLVRDLADGKLDAARLDQLAHFGEDGDCTAYDFEKRVPLVPASTTGSEQP